MDEIKNLRAAIAALDAQRALLGDAVVETALIPLQEKLAALELRLTEPQLKHITVLFSDIVGSTQFSQQRDPEDIQAILNGALQRFQEVINRHEGRVLRFMGDGFKAIFGAPVSREDDAERAIRAGLELLKAAGEYGQSLQLKWGIDQFSIRVGINTGQVLIGGGVEADNNAMGMAVNLGARMESLAAPGCVLITQETYRHVRGLFDIQEQPIAKVKGNDEPLRTYIVLRAREASFRNVTRGLQGMDTPLVGRQAELSQLQEHLKKAAEADFTQIVTIIGEAGVGKSRLLLEFERWIAACGIPMILFKGRCFEHPSNQPYSLLRSMLAHSFNILDSDSLGSMRHKLEGGLVEYLKDDPLMKAHFIGALSGYDFSDSPYMRGLQNDPQQIRDRALFYLTQYFNAATQEAPIVIFLEDIHWADSPSLDAMLTLSRECQRLLIICLARRTLFEQRPEWGSVEHPGRSQQDLIKLSPLSAEDSNQLIDHILKKIDVIPEWLYQLIQNNTEGNPYYIEEIIKNLIEESVLVRDADLDRWLIDASRMGEVKIPPTLTALLQARLDRLPIEEKRTLQQASVVGRIFWDAVLGAIRSGSWSTGMEGQAWPELAALQQRDLVYPQQQSAFAGTQEYSFRHSLLRETAYRTLLKTNRKAYHARVAEWLLNTSQAIHREDEYAAIIAEHFDEAGESGRAAEWYLRAGKLAIAKASAQEALTFFDRALKLIPPLDHSMRWQVLLGRSEALGILGDTAARLETDRELVALAHLLGDEQRLGEAYYRQGFCLGRIGDYLGERLAYERALDYAGRTGDRDLETLVFGLQAVLLSRQGDLKAATLAAEKALLHVRASNQEEVLAKTLINIGSVFSEAGDIGKSIQLFIEGIQVSRQMGNQLGATIGLENLGYNYLQMGLFEMGRDILEQAVVQAQSIGNLHNRMLAQLNIASCLIRMKDAEGALTLLDQIGREASRLGDTFSRAVCQTYTGMALEQKGEIRDASGHFAEAYSALKEMGVHSYAIDAQAGLARCNLLESQIEKARLEANKIWEYLKQSGSSGLEAPILTYLTIARVFDAAGDSESARTVIEKGIADLSERAARISNPEWVTSYMNNFPEHREIIELKRAFRIN